MPWWHQKNDLCYNSRLTRYEFKCILVDYCKGISAKQSSEEFKTELGKNISRQTISKYFNKISKLVLDVRGTYPWWSVDHWINISDKQLDEIRKAVYNYDNMLSSVRKDLLEVTGKSISVDTETYIKVLRDMSQNMNGLPKKNFWVHLGRACEIAYYIDAGYSDPSSAMYSDLLYMFEFDGHFIFNRKASPTTRAENKQFEKRRKETQDQRMFGSKFEECPESIAEREWWYSLDEDAQKLELKKANLSVFTNDIEFPHKKTFFSD